MHKFLKYFSIIMFFPSVMFSGNATAQIPSSIFLLYDNSYDYHISGFTGFDPSIIVGFSGGFKFRTPFNPVILSGSVTSPVFLLKEMDHLGFSIEGQTLLLKSKWNIKLATGLRSKFFSNISDGNTFSLNAGLMAGHFTNRWYAGFDIIYRNNLTTYLKHNKPYSSEHPEVENGWYSNLSGYFYFSAVAGLKLTDRLETSIKISYKIPHTFQLYDPFTIPWAFTLTVSALF
ncbi:hypothetical protein KKF34_05620 [Myxococcota bacterium]|nr:hypothetical protein [Myxococcota bacterium]MBU1380326.1 hypothetical protein [Myxococcota bacterium]MBU1496340.1 hypothetical protein [Myxococcota bacterium]